MNLARITLDCGWCIALTNLEISLTYGGLLEGYPNPQMNEHLLARLGRRREYAYRSQPAHVILPERSYPDRGRASGRTPFGPVEVLPPVYCQGDFRSTRINSELDPVLHQSWLVVVWFQESLADPVGAFKKLAVRDLAWGELAEDFEV